ncbi:hypothetical protein TWF281_009600 [Arthrobotrys megalospora]
MSNQVPVIDLTGTTSSSTAWRVVNNSGPGPNPLADVQLIDLTNPDDDDDDTDSDSDLEDAPPPQPPKNEGPVLLSPQSVNIILTLLCQKVPLELALQIINFADIHPCSILASRTKPDMEQYSLYSGRKTYLTAQIPFFDDPDNLRSKRRTPSTKAPIKRIINKLVFKIAPKFHRSGWLYPRASERSFLNSYSFLEVEIWRRKYDGYKEDIKTNLEKQRKIAAQQPGGSEDDPEQNYKIRSRNSEAWNKEFHDHYHGYSKGGKYEEAKHKNGKFKVGTWLLQRDMNPSFLSPGYEVVWDWRHDELPDSDPNKWELGVGTGRWHKGGKVANGAFVRELREGDELRVVMRALENRVRCSVYGCEIECWWAI